MTSYLRSYIESVADVPQELNRKFAQIRELDERTHLLEKTVDADTIAQLRQASREVSSPAKRQRTSAADELSSEVAERLERNMNELIKLSDEKVNIANQVYDYIDRHISKLDKDLQAFSAEIAKDRQKAGLPPPEGAAGDAKRKRKDGAAAQPPPKPTDEELYQQALAIADPNEPKYCTCQRISFGEMIACDNDDCPIEWFHYGCVGITEENRPKNKWYCEACRKLGQK
eukprot:scaffold4.g4807.t1